MLIGKVGPALSGFSTADADSVTARGTDLCSDLMGRMPFVLEQPNLDKASKSHLYFDPGDGRLITVFTDESRKPDAECTLTDPGGVHYIAEIHLADAIERLVPRNRGSLSEDRRPNNPYQKPQMRGRSGPVRQHGRSP